VSTRTTLTLDDDVADRLATEARRSGKPYRVVVNSALRRGLDAVPFETGRFQVEARPMGLRSGFDLEDIEGLLDRLDGPTRR
jgi:predicted transcriptional regulator